MNCVFCGVVNGTIPARIIAENKNAIAFLDANPMSDGHTLVISKMHYTNISETPKEVLKDMISLVNIVANRLNNSKMLKPWGINYLSNEGKIAGQEVNHVHIHIIPKYGKDEGFKFGLANNHIITKTLDEVKEELTANYLVAKDAK